MKIRQLMTTDVSTAEPETTLEEIATIMRNDDVGAVPVVENDELVGIITDRDLVLRCIAEGKDPSATRADDILSDSIETIEPDADVEEAAELMSRRQIRRLPVVEDGHLVGMLSIGDVAVKQQDDSMSGDTLQKVSRGVKRSSKPAQAQSKQSAKKKTPRAEKQAPIRGPKSAGTHSQNEGHVSRFHDTDQEESDSRLTRSNVRGRAHKDEGQGITNHSAGQEGSRQSRVVSIRPEAKAGKTRRRAS